MTNGIWIDKERNEINIPFDLKDVGVNVGGDQYVEVNKLFGPQCSSRIRVHHNLESCEWVVEEHNFHNDTWVERARFDAQEFYDDKYNKE